MEVIFYEQYNTTLLEFCFLINKKQCLKPKNPVSMLLESIMDPLRILYEFPVGTLYEEGHKPKCNLSKTRTCYTMQRLQISTMESSSGFAF